PPVPPDSTGTTVAEVRPPVDPVRPPPDPVRPPPPDPLPALALPATTFDASVIMRAVVERKPAPLGDLNGDGRCDVADAMLAARADAERRRR
ncbi:MAG: hypothetical protein HUU15_08485, partial [Candidatus Brocadiae bacterium]|nr:hypothetical protein [Candidatus Brocadiia bacterium]